MVSAKVWSWELECGALNKECVKTGQPLEDGGRREEETYTDKIYKEEETKKKLQEEERVKGGNIKR
jgi:IS5 family transposase